MAKGLKEFTVTSIHGFGVWNLEKLAELSSQEFRRRYTEDMQSYFEHHPSLTVSCHKCREQINRPSDLIRVYGTNVHVDCFRSAYKGEREICSELDARYFDLVLASLVPFE